MVNNSIEIQIKEFLECITYSETELSLLIGNNEYDFNEVEDYQKAFRGEINGRSCVFLR